MMTKNLKNKMKEIIIAFLKKFIIKKILTRKRMKNKNLLTII